ncbi:hypothetical protein HZS_2542 [Henneguya salminicola]|nr:hypothetical protein HZS_2542 [Henneguya salminicola]
MKDITKKINYIIVVHTFFFCQINILFFSIIRNIKLNIIKKSLMRSSNLLSKKNIHTPVRLISRKRLYSSYRLEILDILNISEYIYIHDISLTLQSKIEIMRDESRIEEYINKNGDNFFFLYIYVNICNCSYNFQIKFRPKVQLFTRQSEK